MRKALSRPFGVALVRGLIGPVAAAFMVLLASCTPHGSGTRFSAYREGNYLRARVVTSIPICIMTYRVYYHRFIVLKEFSHRPGLDFFDCEVNINPGKTVFWLRSYDRNFDQNARNRTLCADITYYYPLIKRAATLKHVTVCA